MSDKYLPRYPELPPPGKFKRAKPSRGKPKIGRPTKLNEQLIEDVCKLVRLGNYLETAAAYCGIDKATLHKWLRWGSDNYEGKDRPKRREEVWLYRAFNAAVEKAQAEAEVGDQATLTKAAMAGQWQAAAWRLERKFPDRYGRRVLEHQGKDGGPIQHVHEGGQGLLEYLMKLEDGEK